MFNKLCIRFLLFLSVCLSISFGSHGVYGETIIGFGDSITKGWPYVIYSPNGGRVGGYEPTLETLLNNIGKPSQVFNYGVGGEITPSGVNRISNVLGARRANYILILEGINDYTGGISSSTTLFNLGVMIDKSLAYGVTPVIGTLTPYPPHNVESLYNQHIRRIAQEKDALLADQYGVLRSNWNALNKDGLHPNNAGYQAMAQEWFDALELQPEGNEPPDDYDQTPHGSEAIPVYRFYSSAIHRQLLTLDENEKNYLVDNMADAWEYQGIVWYVYPLYEIDTLPVYRFYNHGLQSHLFTLDENEKDYIITNMKYVWRYESMAFFVFPNHTDGTAPVYRLYNPSLTTHFFTMDSNERDLMLSAGEWNDEGVAYYAFPKDNDPPDDDNQTPPDDYDQTPHGGDPIPVHRFYSPVIYRQLLTLDENEKNYIVNNMADLWQYEGIVWYVYSLYENDTLPVFRFYSPELQSHLFSMDENEKNYIVENMKDVWRYESMAFFVFPNQKEDTSPIYRMYNPSLITHFFTMDSNERDAMLSTGEWNDEGIAYYAFPRDFQTIDSALPEEELKLRASMSQTAAITAQTTAENVKAELVWSQLIGQNYQIMYSRYENNRWSGGVNITNNDSSNMHPCIGKGADGVTYVVWTVINGMESKLFFSQYNGVTWTSPAPIPTDFKSNTAPSVFVMQDNVPWIVWSGFDGQVDNIYFSKKTADRWDTPQTINLDNAVPDILPVIGADVTGKPWVHWSGYDGNGNYRNYSSVWTGNEWKAETQEETNNNTFQAKIKLMLRSVPILPESLTKPEKASIYIHNGGEVQSLPLRYLEKVVEKPIQN
jgi:lysophospholipase L1-like esterase